MAWSEKTKLHKPLIASLNEAGYTAPKEIQTKLLSRINGGQDVIAIGPEGCGKTTTYVLGVLNRFNYKPEGVPKALILTPDKESVIAVAERFNLLNRNKTIAIVQLYAAPGIESQMDALADGADIVIATPDRARALYLKLGLNLHKIEMLILDDAEKIVKQGLQLQVAELANSIGKCQHLVFTELVHQKLEKMIAPFMHLPATVEVEENSTTAVPILPHVLYHVDNFGTKLNLLNLFVEDTEVFSKVIVFANTPQTAEKIYERLQNRTGNVAGLLKPRLFEMKGYASVAEFIASETRILIAITEDAALIETGVTPIIIHFELPAEKQIFIDRLTQVSTENHEQTLCITFTTDLELSTIKKVEQAIGQKLPIAELPEGVLIEKERSGTKAIKNEVPGDEQSTTGSAFHEKKASNSKTYNYSSGQKAKMNKKKKYG